MGITIIPISIIIILFEPWWEVLGTKAWPHGHAASVAQTFVKDLPKDGGTQQNIAKVACFTKWASKAGRRDYGGICLEIRWRE